MSDPNRTHNATPKRVREFRQRGEIALSRDLVSAAALAGGVIGLVAFASTSAGSLLELTRATAASADGSIVAGLPGRALHSFTLAAAPVTIGAGVGATVAIVAQAGWPPALKKPGFDLAKLNPLTNLQETFGLAGIARRGGGALLKLIAIGAVVAAIILRDQIATHAIEPTGIGHVVWANTRALLWAVLGVLVVLAAGDYVLARRRITNRMKMTPDEVKREHREQDGDPIVRGRRRQKMRELAKRRMAKAVAGADVVVVNPTHYAVALRYRDGQDRAPVVVAKGVDEAAEKIREVARKHGVPVVSRPPLARALFKTKEGRTVPAPLYRAVAEVLAYVYRLRGARS